MTRSLRRENPPGPNSDTEVAATMHLLHRRRGWAWTAGGSLIALVAFSPLAPTSPSIPPAPPARFSR